MNNMQKILKDAYLSPIEINKGRKAKINGEGGNTYP